MLPDNADIAVATVTPLLALRRVVDGAENDGVDFVRFRFADVDEVEHLVHRLALHLAFRSFPDQAHRHLDVRELHVVRSSVTFDDFHFVSPCLVGAPNRVPNSRRIEINSDVFAGDHKE